MAKMKHYIHQWLLDDSRFEFVVIINNGSEQNIIFDKVKFTVHSTLNFVTKILNFQVLLLQRDKFVIF